MSTFFAIIAGIAGLVVVGSLLLGLVTMVRTGEGARHTSNKLMQYRVVAQGVAIVVMLIAVWLASHGK